ncbi:MAG: OmpA family protein [Polyangiaceae bacterium]
MAAATLVAGLLSTAIVGCGSAKVEVKAGGTTAKKHVEGTAKKGPPPKLEEDAGVKKAVEEKVHVKEYQKITIKDNEVDLNPGVAINFQSGSDKLTDDSYPVLYEIWSFLSDNPDVKIRVEGNTDATGDRNQNQDLSWNRAGRVYEFFVDAGIDPSRLDLAGCGQDNPISYETTPDANAINRRVDFIIMKDTSIVCGGVYDAPAEGGE